MTFRHPDSPALISLSRLAEMDKAPAGTYLAQSKIDGRRRCAFKIDGKWHWRAKNRGDSQPIPSALREEFEALPWPDGIGLDLEWSSLRRVGDSEGLWIFDLLMWEGQWCTEPFSTRRALLYNWINPPECGTRWNTFQHATRVHILPCTRGGGMVDLFQSQLTNPLSEGIVIRRADQVNIGHHEKSVVSPTMWKTKFSRIREV